MILALGICLIAAGSCAAMIGVFAAMANEPTADLILVSGVAALAGGVWLVA